MNKNRFARVSFAILGTCFLAVSLMTGCAWSAEGNGVRVNSPADESLDEEDKFQTP
ncbi:MAG: hypothetical protein WD490_04595 [Opitutales bacterium]